MHNPILLFHAMIIPDAKAAKSGRNERCQHGRRRKSTRGQSSRHHKKAKQFIFDAYGFVLFETLGTRTEVPKNAKAAVVPRLDVVNNDSGSYAVFTEQGSSVSQMTAATALHTIFGLPGCSGQASDAVSAYTQVTLEHAH